MSNKTTISYSNGSIYLHWIIAVIVLLMLSLSFFLGDIPKAFKPVAYTIHKSMGLTVLFLMLVRIIWIFVKGKPSLPNTMPSWQKVLARVVQYSLYVFLILMPMSGWVMSVAADKIPSYFGLFHITLPLSPDKALAEFMNETHETIAFILIALISLHIVGALKHYLIDKDEVMQSMFIRHKNK